MSSGLKRATHAERILLTATIALTGGLVGCDNAQNQADKQVRQQLTEARLDAAAGKPDAARQKLNDAAKDNSASNSLRASAKAAVAQDQLAQADVLISRIEREELNVVRLVSEISALTEQIRSGGTTAVGYKQLDPKPTLDKIAADVATAEGSADKPAWFSGANGASIPTLTAIKQQLAQLESQLTAQQDQVTSLTQQRQRVLDDAEKSAAEADQGKGDASVTAFKKAADLRKQAGDLAVQIDKAQSAIVHLKASIATAQAQQTSVAETIKQLKDQAATIDKAWKEMDSRAAAQRQLAARILGDNSAAATGPSVTITQKAAELGKSTAQLKQLRGEATAALNSASTYFDDAAKAAEDLVKELDIKIRNASDPNRPEVAAWQTIKTVMDPAQYKLQRALVLRKLGTLNASAAASLRLRIALSQSLGSALQANDLRSTVAVVDTGAPQEQAASLAAAEASFTEALELLSNIVESSAPDATKDRARIARSLTNYSIAQLARQTGDPDSQANKKKIDEPIQLAKDDRDLVAEHYRSRNIPLPSMPAELGEPKFAPPPAEPGAAPTGEPGTAPSVVNPADSPEQAAVRAVMAKLTDSLEKGDAAGFKALMQIEPGQEAFADQFLQLPVVFKKVEDALTAKFGAPTSQPDSEGKFTFGPTKTSNEVATAKIEVNGDTALLDGGDEPLSRMTRVNGEWKLVLGAPKDEAEAKDRAVVVQMITALSTLATDIEAGKYAKREDAGMAMIGMMMQAAAPSQTTGAAQASPPAPAQPPQ